MNNSINYKQKYQELKMKYMESIDLAFRLGFEQGAQQAQQDHIMQQQQQQAELDQAMVGNKSIQQDDSAINGQPDMMAPGQNAQGSELDQHIAKLEQMMGSKESKPEDIQKALTELKSFRQEQLLQIEMKKSSQAIPAIAKALHKPAFKIGVNANHNMTTNAKQAVGMQHKIVNDIMKAWEDEEQKATKNINQILNIEGLIKKE